MALISAPFSLKTGIKIMTNNPNSAPDRWSSHFVFMLATIGSAVGLGNIWKFPYIMGENGGGAFVIVYLLCIAFIGLPVFIAEAAIGKKGRKNPWESVKDIAAGSGASKNWQVAGWVGMLTGFLILSFYSVIAGWAAAYVFKAASGSFVNASAEQVGDIFVNHITNPYQLVFWQTLFIVVTCFIVAKGVQKGLEKAVNTMMPTLFLLLVVLLLYAAKIGDFSAALSFMFNPDFSKLTVNGVLVALGHAFFTLSLASGIIIMYGAYLPQDTPIVKTAVGVAIADTVVALMAGLAIFPIVFANGLAPQAGPGLVFQTLPIALGQMPAGIVFSTLFFVMILFATLTSSISMIESSIVFLIEKFNLSRKKASLISGSLLWLIGFATIASFSGMEFAKVDFHYLGKDVKNWFDIIDHTTSDILLPLGGLFIALFAGWVMKKADTSEQLQTSPVIFTIWQTSVRWIAPLAIVVIFLQLIGIISF